MSPWPWLKDAKLVADPNEAALPPTVETRQSISSLLSEHSQSIAALRSAIGDDPLFDEAKHDDLWLLRFILSHKGKITKAAKACKHTLQYRATHQLDENDIRFEPPSRAHPKTRAFLECGEEGLFAVDLPDASRGTITYLHLEAMDQHQLIAKVPDEDVQSFFIYMTEWCHQWLDYVTRTTGLLTKAIRIVDLRGMSLDKVNRANLKRNARCMNEMEDCYPQLLQSVFPCHAPIFVQGVWSTFRPLLPSRLVSKFDFINPEHRGKDLEKLLRHVNAAHLPERFGGTSSNWPVKTTLPSES